MITYRVYLDGDNLVMERTDKQVLDRWQSHYNLKELDEAGDWFRQVRALMRGEVILPRPKAIIASINISDGWSVGVDITQRVNAFVIDRNITGIGLISDGLHPNVPYLDTLRAEITRNLEQMRENGTLGDMLRRALGNTSDS